MDIRERIQKVVPQATFTEQGDLIAHIPADSFEKLAKYLYYDTEDRMDFLRDIVGMDWGETLGALYYLESTKTHERIVLRTETLVAYS